MDKFKTKKLLAKRMMVDGDDLDLNAIGNVAHQNWELLDPTPDIHQLFARFDKKFFRGRLKSVVKLNWSSNLFRVSGLCCPTKQANIIFIMLSEPLLKLRSRKEVIEVLLVSKVERVVRPKLYTNI